MTEIIKEDSPNHWKYLNEEIKEIPGDAYGFVYRITNHVDNKQYIGKKQFYSTTRQKVKGKVNRKKVIKESDWKDYYGSNKYLKEDVENYGAPFFSREILRYCKSKGELSYYEAKYQFEEDVLFDDKYYNSWITCKIHKNHLT